MSSSDWRPARLPIVATDVAGRMNTPPPRPIAQGLPTRKAPLRASDPWSGVPLLSEFARSARSAPMNLGSVLLAKALRLCSLSASSAAVRLLDGEPEPL